MFSKKEKLWLNQAASGEVDRETFSYNYEQKLMSRIREKVAMAKEELDWFSTLDVELNHRS